MSPIYELGPSGATFSPFITLSIKYERAVLPEGFRATDLVISTWDGTSGRWVAQSSTVNVTALSVTANISHFSTYAVIAHTRPATFELGPLNVTPAQINLGEQAQISVQVRNTGDLAGSCNISLQIDGGVTKTEGVTLEGSSSIIVNFNASPMAGSHTIKVGDLMGNLIVKEPAPSPLPLTTSAAPGPAVFSLSQLNINPDTVNLGETAEVSILVTNSGDSKNNYDVILKISNLEEIRQEVNINSGQSAIVLFPLTLDVAGDYILSIGSMSGRLVVLSPQPSGLISEEPSNPPGTIADWWLTGVVITAIIIAGIMVFVLLRRRRS
jgi:hypothetical protein